MILKYLYISLAIVFLGIGVYAWKITNTGIYLPNEDEEGFNQISEMSHVLYVGRSSITQEDIEWEYEMHTKGLLDSQDLTPIPEIYDNQNVLESLREQLMANLIERKLLYQYLKNDNEFHSSDPARFIECLEQWQAAVGENPEFFENESSRERLKSRLCEKSLIVQYLQERIFSQIKVSEEEIATYYNANKSEFDQPEKVEIRQIVLGSENEAKRIRAKLTYQNFEEMARQVSISPESENGGLLGPFAKGEMPSHFDIAFNMRKGEIRGVLKSTYGFHFIRLEKKIPSVKLTLEKARPDIVKKLTLLKQEQEYQKWVEMALNEIPVKSPRSP